MRNRTVARAEFLQGLAPLGSDGLGAAPGFVFVDQFAPGCVECVALQLEVLVNAADSRVADNHSMSKKIKGMELSVHRFPDSGE